MPVVATTCVISTGGVGYGIRMLNRKLDERRVPLLGIMGAFIFAAQMLNFPVVGGTSGHLIGAALAAILLGPWTAVVIMSCVLIVQCLIFQDGGLLALGANVLNMGIIASFVGYYSHRGIAKLTGEGKEGRLAGFVAAWITVLLASVACAIELALSGTVPLKVALPAMAGVHALIGLGEGAITVAVVSLVTATRRDLLELQKT